MNKKILILQNQITPYRSIVFDELAKKYKNNLLVVYCNKVESNRKWIIDDLKHNSRLLNKSFIKIGHKFIYFNFDVISVLKNFSPDVVITYGFNPVMLLAWIYTFIKRKRHLILTDSWLLTVNKLTFFHRLVRKVVFKYTHAFICVGKKGIEYLKEYKVDDDKIFISQLVTDNDYYRKFIFQKKEYDFVFSGRFIDIKKPFFVIDVLKILKEKLPNINILLIGSGEVKDQILEKLKEENIDYYYPGFIQQKDLPKYYASAKLLLFPTEQDPWGLVANEACAVGVPVITCDNAGVAGDLIIDGYNGYILPLQIDVWVKKIEIILNDKKLYEKLSENALRSINKFTVELASKGIDDAIIYATH